MKSFFIILKQRKINSKNLKNILIIKDTINLFKNNFEIIKVNIKFRNFVIYSLAIIRFGSENKKIA